MKSLNNSRGSVVESILYFFLAPFVLAAIVLFGLSWLIEMNLAKAIGTAFLIFFLIGLIHAVIVFREMGRKASAWQTGRRPKDDGN